jgi:hypothetical protein
MRQCGCRKRAEGRRPTVSGVSRLAAFTYSPPALPRTSSRHLSMVMRAILCALFCTLTPRKDRGRLLVTRHLSYFSTCFLHSSRYSAPRLRCLGSKWRKGVTCPYGMSPGTKESAVLVVRRHLMLKRHAVQGRLSSLKRTCILQVFNAVSQEPTLPRATSPNVF